MDVAPVNFTRLVVDRANGRRRRGQIPIRLLAILVESGARVKVAVVVPTDGHLVRVREPSEPVDGGLDLARTAIVAEIARVDQEITVRDIRPFEGVCVGDADDADGLPWESRRATQVQQQAMQWVDECGQRGGAEVFGDTAAVEWTSHDVTGVVQEYLPDSGRRDGGS